MRTEKYWRKT